jgi:hypothetical protein
MKGSRRHHGSFSIVAALLMVSSVTLVAASPASAARPCAYFEFDKGTNLNSTLLWRYVNDFGQCTLSHSYRAGSGDTTDPCQVNHGWLPNGWYDVTFHQNTYSGSLIFGRVWRLSDKACSGGTLRTELFIHSEQTSSNGQVCTSNADDLQCWDKTPGTAGTNDYYSNGCIKVRRPSAEGSWADDVSSIHSDWHNLGAGSGHGNLYTDGVYVHA